MATPKPKAPTRATGSMRKPSTVVKPKEQIIKERAAAAMKTVSYTHLRAHETLS
jgi:hypothetical protein